MKNQKAGFVLNRKAHTARVTEAGYDSDEASYPFTSVLDLHNSMWQS
jgi:hypothetical protein